MADAKFEEDILVSTSNVLIQLMADKAGKWWVQFEIIENLGEQTHVEVIPVSEDHPQLVTILKKLQANINLGQ